jgi:23S rRNA pseudouridine2605 synthase
MSRSGVTSRRKAEDLIRAGRVSVNGQVVSEPGFLVDTSKDDIKLNGRLLRPQPSPIYLMLNKPSGVITTVRDPQGRTTVLDLIKGPKVRVFPVGRLDYHTEGLLVLTNDGDLAHRLMHPSYGMKRTYQVKVKGIPTREELDQLRMGIYLKPGLCVRAQVRICRTPRTNAWLEMVLQERRHREVRRMCEAIGHPVLILRRIRFGPLTLHGLPRGKYRHLTDLEVKNLLKAVGLF